MIIPCIRLASTNLLTFGTPNKIDNCLSAEFFQISSTCWMLKCLTVKWQLLSAFPEEITNLADDAASSFKQRRPIGALGIGSLGDANSSLLWFTWLSTIVPRGKRSFPGVRGFLKGDLFVNLKMNEWKWLVYKYNFIYNIPIKPAVFIKTVNVWKFTAANIFEGSSL